MRGGAEQEIGGKRAAWRPVLFVWLFASAAFLLLYRRFLFGNAVPLYSDTGSDSLAASFPILGMVSWLFRSGTFDYYTLSAGLGQDTTATFLQFVNPLKFFMLFFDENSMPAAILIQMYLQTVVSALAFFGLMRRHVRRDGAAVFSAVIWSFSSYAVLWGQNLSYGTAVTMFAVSVFLIESFLDRPSLRLFGALALFLGIFLCTNYYFCYMLAVFIIPYIVIRGIFLGHKPLRIAGELLRTAAPAVCALFAAAAAVTAITQSFTSSARTGDIRSLSSFAWGIQPGVVIACLGRLFSENLLGTGDEYRGPANYYEIGVLFTSALFLFAFFYAMQKKELRKKCAAAAAVCVLALLLPVLRYFLNLNHICMRFSFMVCFLECILTALFLDDILQGADPVPVKRAVFWTVLFSAASWAAVYAGCRLFEYRMNGRALLFSAFFIAVFSCFLLAAASGRLPARSLAAGLVLLILAEIVIMHHDTLYLRLYLTKESFAGAFFNSGTREAVRAVGEEDPSLYRISTTEDPLLSNEGQLDHFNGTTLRNNTNPGTLITLARLHGTNDQYTPYFMSGYPEYYQFTFLSGKYLVTDLSADRPDTAETTLFREKELPDTGFAERGKAVYENVNALPFGYLYRREVTRGEYEEQDLDARMKLLSGAFFYTEEEEAGEDAACAPYHPEEHPDPDTRTDLIRGAEYSGANYLDVSVTEEGMTLTPTGEDPYVYVDLSGTGDTAREAQWLLVEAEKPEDPFYIQFFYQRGDSPADAAWTESLYFSSVYPSGFLLLPEGVTGFRMDVQDGTEQVKLNRFCLIGCRDAGEHLRELQETEISGISFLDDTYRAQVETGDGGGMLCVPLLYSDNWQAEVNGEPVPVRNINGGLTGIPLKEGSCSVVMRYRLPGFPAAAAVSAVSCLLLFALIFTDLWRWRKHA